MTAVVVYPDPAAPVPTLAPVGVPDASEDQERLRFRVQVAAAVPAVISVGVHWVFLISFWIPETAAFPAHAWWLAQLSPLASTAVTSAGETQVAAQASAVGFGGDLLLVASVVLLLFVRHPGRVGQTAVLLPAAFGVAVSVVVLLALLVAGSTRSSAVALWLLVAWVGCALYVAFSSLLLDLGPARPRRWRNGLPLLAAYAVIGPAPTAVGRALFGGALRDVAATLQANTVTLRLAALTNAATVPLYLAGLLVGVSIWAAYQCWPPRRDRRTLLRVGVLVLALVLTAALGALAGRSAGRQAVRLRTTSPIATVHFSCGHALLRPPDDEPGPTPARTAIVTGLGCHSLTTFAGYRQLGTRSVDFSLAPVKVRTPAGAPLTGPTASAQYGDVLVLAGTDRLDTGANRLVAVRVSDGTLLWQFSCAAPGPMRVRFARVPAGEDAALGHLTRGERAPQVVARCGERTLRSDPLTGRGAP